MAPSATLTAPAPGRAQCVGGSGDSERIFDLPLEHDTLAPGTARHAAAAVLAEWGLDEGHVHDALLVVSELVTNAVAHAKPPVVLHMTLTADPEAGLRVHVTDGGPAPAPTTWTARRPGDEHGRGAGIISALTQAAGTSDDLEGLIDHWANLDAA